ncbi:MAG: MGDG synthase family glycosyltransferase [Aquificaceae bacterium]
MTNIDVLILSSSFGGGHKSVSEALKEAMEEAYGLKVFIVDPYELLSEKLNRLNARLYIKLMRKASALYGLFYNLTYDLGMNNIINRIGSCIGRGKLLELISSYKPKVVVSTYPTYTGMLSNLKERGIVQSYLVTVITDFAAHSQWIHGYIDAYFVASYEVALTLIKKGIANERIYVSGIPIKKSFSEEYNVGYLREKYRLEPGIPLILVMNVSFGNPNVLKEVCKTLSSLNIAFQSLVLCGRDERLYKIASSFGNRINAFRWQF